MQNEHSSFSVGLRTLRSRMGKALWVLVPWQMLGCFLIALFVAEHSLHYMVRSNVPFSWGVLLRDTMMDNPWSSFAYHWLSFHSLYLWGGMALSLLPVLLWPRRIISYLPVIVFCLLHLLWVRYCIRGFYYMSVSADYAHQLPAWLRFIVM